MQISGNSRMRNSIPEKGPPKASRSSEECEIKGRGLFRGDGWPRFKEEWEETTGSLRKGIEWVKEGGRSLKGCRSSTDRADSADK